MAHLGFDVVWAAWNNVKQDHPQKVMKELGITYQHSTPQTMGDQWWFWNCENIPDPLPPYLEVADLNPMDCIGYGLSKEDAEKIRDYVSPPSEASEQKTTEVVTQSEKGTKTTELNGVGLDKTVWHINKMDSAEEILDKHTTWSGDVAYRDEESMLKAMQEYSLLERSRAREEMSKIIYDDSYSAQEKISELKKLIN